MKHFKRKNIYKASNVSFNPETYEAYSHDWWCFVKVIGGKVVFNSYYYSPSTCGHQYKVKRLLNKLGINIDLEIECPAGLQDYNTEKSVSEHYSYKIKELKAAIMKPRSHARKNMERKELINKYAKLAVEFKLLTEKKAA